MTQPFHPENLFLNVAQVAARYGISKDSVWRWSSTGDLPKPVKLGPNVTRWRLADLLEHDQNLTSCFAFSLELAA